MTEEAYDDTLETSVDDTAEQLESLIVNIEEYAVNLQYLPHIYKTSVLILGVMIVFILVRFVTSFINRCFSDNGNY